MGQPIVGVTTATAATYTAALPLERETHGSDDCSALAQPRPDPPVRQHRADLVLWHSHQLRDLSGAHYHGPGDRSRKLRLCHRATEPAVGLVATLRRSVNIVTQLISAEQRLGLVETTRCEYTAVRDRVAQRAQKREFLTIAAARSNKIAIRWGGYKPPVPENLDVQVISKLPLETLIPYIDWSPFFRTWELAGKYPQILDDSVVGEAARSLFDDAQAMLATLVADGRLEAHGVFGFWPCNREGDDDLVLYTDENREQPLTRLHHLRQQTPKPEGKHNFCLADFVAPRGSADYLGGFAVTAGVGIESVLSEYQDDDYSSIMIKSLADRLAEAFAEYLHQQVRHKHWGYAAQESLDTEALIREDYRGIRPAPGYPACPDHSEKRTLFQLLDVERRAHIELTEQFAMLPAAAVSGWYFSHPDARYFGVGKIDRDQLEDYAARKEVSISVAEDWVRPNL